MIYGRNYVNGNFIDAKQALHPQKVFSKVNPSNEENIGLYPDTDRESVNGAVAFARKSQKDWRKLSRIKRAEYFDNLIGVMRGWQNIIIDKICLDTGKTYNEASAEFNEAVHMIQYTFAQAREPYGKFVASEIAEKDITQFRKPKGVVAVIAPWNFPFAIPFWTSAPALIEGNTVVFKPSEDAPLTGEIIARLYHEAGFPEGVFNVVHGSGHTGDYLLNADVDHICFTGSVAVGQHIRRHVADTFHKSCSCEMGSKSAVIVFDDALSDMSINACIASAFKLSGQRCVSSGRLLIHKNIYDAFCEKFVEAAKKVKTGNVFFNLSQPEINGGADKYDHSIFYGPLINASQFERVRKFNALTDAEGVQILLEGKKLDQKGYYLTPHVYKCDWKWAHNEDEHGHTTHPFLRQEVFGPHVALIPFNDADDAVRIYNDTDYGLSMAVCTNNATIARYMRDNCDYGLGYHNLPSVGAESHCVFGGVKASGYGGSSAAGTFHAVTHEVTWTANFDQSGFKMAQGLK